MWVRRQAAAAVILAGWLLAAVAADPRPEETEAPPARVEYGEPRKLCELADQRVDESSGLACSRRTSGVFWTHNDSGDRPRIFAFNRRGEDLGTFRVLGAAALDWEDMASVRLGEKPYLLCADTGDNARRRKTATVYLVEEPALGKDGEPPRGAVGAAQAIHFTYEDGPQNCEAVAIDATEGVLYLVTKTVVVESKVYALPLPGKTRDGPPVAKVIARLKARPATAMDISPDGLRAVVLTYGHAFEYVRTRQETWTDAFSREPRLIAMPTRALGESICYGPDGKTLYLTSEGLPTPLWEVPVAGR